MREMMDTRTFMMALMYLVVISSVAVLAWQEGHHAGMEKMCDDRLVLYENDSVGCEEKHGGDQRAYPDRFYEIAAENMQGGQDG